jgi:hypothetical protein
MITRSEDYVEYCRETARHLRDIQDLALRGKNQQALTQRIHQRIAREVDLRPDDDLHRMWRRYTATHGRAQRRS